MNRARLLTAVLLASGAGACGNRAPSPSPRELENAALGGDMVARVGDTSIPSMLVARVAASRAISARDATTLLVEDALAARGATAARLEGAPGVAWALGAQAARLVALRLQADAKAAGQATDAELQELTKLHWREVDLPEQRLVMHAVLLRPNEKGRKAGESSPEVAARGRAAAAELARSLAGVGTAELESRAQALPHEGFELKVEQVPPFVADGRRADPPPRGPDAARPEDDAAAKWTVDEKFASAAFALQQPGETTGAVETPFGWHVIRLLERLPAKRAPLAERRERFEAEAQSLRARRAMDGLLKAARERTAVEISTAAETLMAEVSASAPRP